jgi:uncharacterized membrane protein
MAVSYNHIAGQSVERLAALSDGFFAVAMMLLLLDLRVPAIEAMQRERELWRALVALSPRLVMYMTSFMMLGIFWIRQQTQLNHLARSDRSLSWMHIVFLFTVSIIPFSTSLLAEFPEYAPHFSSSGEYSVFGKHVVLQLAVCVGNGTRVKHDLPPEVSLAVKRRIVVAQSLYAFGALLCVFSTYWSIAFIVLVQLSVVIAPFGRRSRS